MVRRMRVGLFVTCLVDLVSPEVGVATARVLARAGHEVVFPEGQTCCGQPAFNAGYREEAATVLRSTLRALASAEVDAYVAGLRSGEDDPDKLLALKEASDAARARPPAR